MSNRRKSQGLSSEAKELDLCADLLKEFQEKDAAAPFLDPVDWEELGLPDYPEIVKNPMDLGTIEKKLTKHEYANAEEFANDVRLVWNNAKNYNQPGSGIYKSADTLAKGFEKKFNAIKPKSSQKRKLKAMDESVSPESQYRLTELIKQMSSDQLSQIVEMLEQKCPNSLNEDDDEYLEIEITAVDSETLQSLITFAESCIENTTKKRKK